ncbi:NAD(P)-binding protein [Saccharata proteae CBS 121410]|uniref:NAD(P)-binding protein n=1 Tax=Saccharata proteae CBS 121410 TaxID=1314787 RepID=A0A9P4LTN6_9PEZI|nr:NAD(P)-binding protein [Saccharata proteae CBS 121410]
MSQHILLLGGHGRISQLLMPLLLARSWAVTSMIRDPAQSATIEKLGAGQPGKLNVLVRSLDDVKSEADAKSILDEVKPSWVVWSAGAGGKGGAPRTYAIDRDAAKHFIRATIATPSITTFLTISYLGSRRNKPTWWNAEDWAASVHVNEKVLPAYADAKIAADEYLVAMAKKRQDGFRAINLRPGTLSAEKAGGVELGRTKGSGGQVSREAVAQVAAELLGSAYPGGWLDMLDGEETVKEAVEKVSREKVDAFEGEDEERILKLAD